MEQLVAAAYGDSDSDGELEAVQLQVGSGVVHSAAWLDLVSESDALRLPTWSNYAQHIRTRMVNAFKDRRSLTEEEFSWPIFVVRFVDRVLLFHAEGAQVGQPLYEPDTPGGVQFLQGEDN